MSRDYKGTPGWNRVDALADELVKLEGLSMTDNDIQHLHHLYGSLDEFDKRPIKYTPRYPKSSKGRLCHKAHRSGHIKVDAVRRY